MHICSLHLHAGSPYHPALIDVDSYSTCFLRAIDDGWHWLHAYPALAVATDSQDPTLHAAGYLAIVSNLSNIQNLQLPYKGLAKETP